MKSTKLCTFLVSAFCAWCQIAVSQESEPLNVDIDGLDYRSVACRLPDRWVQVGGALRVPRRGRTIETTFTECAIRGGEQTIFDRGDIETSLKVWKETAANPDEDDEMRAKAHAYVGEIYEKHLDGPDYAEAARWYQMAADRGSRRGMRNLAYLYEKGLGVERDVERALALWRDASDLQEDLVLASEVTSIRTEAQQKLDAVTAELERQNQNSQRLQQQLDRSREQLNDQRASLAAAQGEVDSMAARLELLESSDSAVEIASLRQELASKRDALDEQEIRIALLETEVTSQQALLQSSAAAAQIHERRLQDALSTIEQQQAENASLFTTLAQRDTQISLLQSKISAANAGIEAQRREKSMLEARLDELSRDDGADPADVEIVALRSQLQRADAEVARGQDTIAQLQDELQQQQQVFDRTLSAAEGQQSELERQLAEMRSERQSLVAMLEESDAEAQILRARLGAVNERLGDQQYEVEQLERELDSARLSLADGERTQSSEIARLETELAEKEQQLEQSNAEMAAVRDQWRDAEGDADALRQQLALETADAENRQLELKARLTALEQQILDVNAERRSLQADLERELEEKRRLIASNEAAGRRLEEIQASSEQDRDEMRAEIMRLNDELDRNGAELAQNESTIRSLRAELLEHTLNLESSSIERNFIADNLTRSAGPAPVPVPPNVDLEGVKYYALIIGNYDYTYVGDLRTVRDDVRTIRTLLEQRYGFEVDLRENLRYQEMLQALGELQRFGKNDFVLVYYAGHGTIDEHGNGYWQPIDYVSGRDESATAIAVDQITAKLNRSNARHVMVIADSCYAGALLRNTSVQVANADFRLPYWISNRSRTVLTSGGVAPVLDSNGGGRSVFTNALVNVLLDNMDFLSGEQLHNRLSDMIRHESAELGLEQTPGFGVLADAGHENGQFVFVPQ